VSFEKPNFPVLGRVEKSVLQEENEIIIPMKNRKVS
jgi:hypothetical protein